jgi:DNA ligase 1
MFNKLAKMLTELEEAKGSIAKELHLTTYTQDKDFCWMAKMALDMGHSFNVNKFPAYKSNDYEVADASIKAWVDGMKGKSGITDEDLQRTWVMACSSPARYKVITRILRKDLRCGVGAKTINKVFPNLINLIGYQRCGSSDKVHKMTYPALLQIKADGMFVYSMPDGSFLTRQGNSFGIKNNPVTLAHRASSLKDHLLILELVVLDDCGCVMDRAVGNGILNSFIQGCGDPQYIGRIRGNVWGYLHPDEFRNGLGARSYKDVWAVISTIFEQTFGIKPVECWTVKSLAAAQVITNKLIANGHEGAIIKSMSDAFVWKDESSSNFQFKLKAEAEAEFLVTDSYLGEPGKKNENRLGGITVTSACGKIISDVGMGFSDAERDLPLDKWIGMIVSVKFNGVTNKEGSDIHALDHPRFVEPRLDKTEADTLEYCIAELKGGLTL